MKLFLQLFTLSSILLITACKKEQPKLSEFNKDCSCATEVSADFAMKEVASHINARYRTETDTILYNKTVWFVPKEADANYTWYIGAEIITEKTFNRYFNGSLKGQTLPITLVVKKTPNNICLPNDDGYDSIVKYLTVSNKNYEDVYDLPNHLFEGTFRFKDSLGNHSEDSVDLDIELTNNEFINGLVFGRRMKITHLGGQDSVVYFRNEYINYREIWIGFGQFYKRARFKHATNGRVEFEMEQGLAIERPSIYFIGRKLN